MSLPQTFENSPTEPSQKIVEVTPPRKVLDLVNCSLSSDSEAGIVIRAPRKPSMKRDFRRFLDLEANDVDDPLEHYNNYKDKFSYSQKDFPIDISSSSDEPQDHFTLNEEMDLECRNIVVFDRQLPPDPLWYINQFHLKPDIAIKLLRSAASYITETNPQLKRGLKGQYKKNKK